MKKSTTPKGVASSLALLPRVGSLHLPTLRYRKYNPDGVWPHRVVWWRLVGAVPVCPPVSSCRGAPSLKSPRTMRVFLVWKRRCADVRAGTQAPPLRFRLARLHVGGFVCWENGAHELTPSVLYFCQPRVADDRRLPWGKSAGDNLCHRHCTF